MTVESKEFVCLFAILCPEIRGKYLAPGATFFESIQYFLKKCLEKVLQNFCYIQHTAKLALACAAADLQLQLQLTAEMLLTLTRRLQQI